MSTNVSFGRKVRFSSTRSFDPAAFEAPLFEELKHQILSRPISRPVITHINNTNTEDNTVKIQD